MNRHWIITGPILAIGSIFCLSLALRALGLVEFQIFGTAEADAKRQVFEQSKSYRDGAVQELQNMQFEYLKTDPEHQKGLRSLILHRAASVPQDAMPDDLRAFIRQISL